MKKKRPTKREKLETFVRENFTATDLERMNALASLSETEFTKHIAKVQKRTERVMERASQALVDRTRCTYVVREEESDNVKIGWTDRPLEKRLAELQAGNPRKLLLERHVRMESAREARRFEKILHRYFADRLIRGEWFELTVQEVADAFAMLLEDA